MRMGVYVCVQAVIIDRDICSGIIYHELGYTFSDVYLEGLGNLAFRFKNDCNYYLGNWVIWISSITASLIIVIFLSDEMSDV